jgi:hypothetical protein
MGMIGDEIETMGFSFKHLRDVPLIVEIANTELELIVQCEAYALL